MFICAGLSVVSISSFAFQRIREVVVTLCITDMEDIFQLSQISAISSFKGIIGLLCYFNQKLLCAFVLLRYRPRRD